VLVNNATFFNGLSLPSELLLRFLFCGIVGEESIFRTTFDVDGPAGFSASAGVWEAPHPQPYNGLH
jgi:hypothetical protein